MSHSTCDSPQGVASVNKLEASSRSLQCLNFAQAGAEVLNAYGVRPGKTDTAVGVYVGDLVATNYTFSLIVKVAEIAFLIAKRN